MNYHNLTYPDMNNGSGLRVVLWLSGCSHKCQGCQNPQTWDADSGIPFDKAAREELFRELDKDYISGLTLTGGDPLFENNLDGVLDLVTEINKRYNAYQHIGGDSKENNDILNDNTDKIRLSLPQKSIWLYTGYKAIGISEGFLGLEPNVITDKDLDPDKLVKGINDAKKRSDIILKCDVLIDGQYIESQRNVSLPWVGSSNQRVINIKESLQKGKIVLWQI